MKYLIIATLLITGCGKSGSNSAPINVTPQPQPGTINTPFQIVLTASRQPNGPPTNGVSTALASERVTLPALTDFSIIANNTDFYHLTLTLGSVSCDYVHQANTAQVSAGAGCSTLNSYVDLTTNDTITLSISGNVNNATTVQLPLTVQYK